mmetsp:Transcript_33041/g.54565  ORF Transcript_33041/g.54565 Transcript_33041/m.54565 type:complete len:102 (+) Transcript_33041:218-523(+)
MNQQQSKKAKSNLKEVRKNDNRHREEFFEGGVTNASSEKGDQKWVKQLKRQSKSAQALNATHTSRPARMTHCFVMEDIIQTKRYTNGELQDINQHSYPSEP